ncbi:ABC transporter substrate-binding protein [Ancylobacter dichloromethanicus]
MPPDDLGIAGAELGIRDNLTSGRFLKLDYKLTSEIVPTDGDPLPAVQKLVEAGDRFILLDVPPDALLKIADAYKDRDVVFINVGATDDRLRQQDCRANVFHIAPSRSMLTDALAQFLVTKRWQNWFLMVGRTDNDKLYAEAVRRSAKKFGAKIVAEKDLGLRAGRPRHRPIGSATRHTDRRIRPSDRRRRTRGVRRHPALQHLAPPPHRRHPGADGAVLASDHGKLGRFAVAEPLLQTVQADDAAAGLPDVAGRLRCRLGQP